MIHEALTYELFRAAGIPAPRTGYAWVRVDGEDYGVYLNLETMANVALLQWFDSTQHLYEGGYDVDVRSSDVGKYEVDEGPEDDTADLEALIAIVDASGAGFSDRLAGVVDLDEMATEWAVERYAGAWHDYTSFDDHHRPNSYYLHSDAAVGSFPPGAGDPARSRHGARPRRRSRATRDDAGSLPAGRVDQRHEWTPHGLSRGGGPHPRVPRAAPRRAVRPERLGCPSPARVGHCARDRCRGA